MILVSQRDHILFLLREIEKAVCEAGKFLWFVRSYIRADVEVEETEFQTCGMDSSSGRETTLVVMAFDPRSYVNDWKRACSLDGDLFKRHCRILQAWFERVCPSLFSGRAGMVSSGSNQGLPNTST